MIGFFFFSIEQVFLAKDYTISPFPNVAVWSNCDGCGFSVISLGD